MVSGEWNGWVKIHAAMFGLNTDQDLVMFEAWREVFSKAGYTVAELHEATAYIAANQPPRWRNEHLAAITSRVLEKRRIEMFAAQRAAIVEYDQHRGHELCSGTGFVYVPHNSCVKAGAWVAPWYTLVVLCDCKRGKRIREVQASSKTKGGDARPVSLGIEAYTLQNPEWQGQMRQRSQLRSAQQRAHAVTEVADKKIGMLSRVVDQALAKAKLQAPAVTEEAVECPF